MRDHFRFIFRGKPITVRDVAPTRSLLDWLREEQRAVGTKEGCNEGDCGACTVVVVRKMGDALHYLPVNACITFVGMVDGAELLTIEDLKHDGRLHAIQQAMVAHHGSQCGFCTPGIVMSLFAMGKTELPITRPTIADQLAGNLCRCTGYRPIMDAALASLAAPEPDHIDQRAAATLAALQALDTQEDVFVGDQARFFAAPRSLDSLLSLLAAHPDATILAGATDVGLWITKQFRPIMKLISIGQVTELKSIQTTGDTLRIGAGVSHADALPDLARISPDLGELGRRFGSTQVRAQGTIGGNIANGSPIGDWAPAFIALDATVTLRRHGKAPRVLPLEAFFLAYGRQDRQPDEIVAAVDIPKPAPDTHFRCFKISKRFDEDISALMGAFRLTVVDGQITAARIAFGGMAATPRRAPQAEAALTGALLADPATWQNAMAALAADYQPITDMRASARYRAEVAGSLLHKALLEIGGHEATRLSPNAHLLEAHHAA